MIRFCDKVVYNIELQEVSRTRLLNFFLEDACLTNAVVAIYENGMLYGTVTYDDILRSGETNVEYINSFFVSPSEDFWTEAREYFIHNPKKLLTIVNTSKEIIGFAYNDNNFYQRVEFNIESLEECKIADLGEEDYCYIKAIVIIDINELAYRCAKVFDKLGYRICAIGEKWEWFGYKSGEGFLDYADFEKLYIYAEGSSFSRYKKRLVTNENLEDAFMGINELVSKNIKEVYKCVVKEMRQLGVPVYEFVIPSQRDIKYMTNLERTSIDIKADLMMYVRSSGAGMNNQQKECIEQIYGKNVCNALLESKRYTFYSDLEKILFGELVGYVIGDNSIRKKRIYLIGPCIVSGVFCFIDDTFPKQLQDLVEEDEYEIISIPIQSQIIKTWMYEMKNLPIRQGDIVMVVYLVDWFPKKTDAVRVDLTYVYNNTSRPTMFSELPLHSNAEANHILAKEVYENYLKSELLQWQDCDRRYLQTGEILNQNAIAMIQEYTDSIRVDIRSTAIGAIVMNCNPFTYGHRYLIEYAAKQVEHLYIFVVEEDRSFFPFSDRLEMVKRGVADLRNVIVVSSGRWMLSYETMPIYFEKAIKQDANVDASKDLEIFARYIAPKLGITKRFVGEEPKDKITAQYNQQMREILGRFGIGLEEIPRKELNGEVISASSVRNYMQAANWEMVSQLVPETTYKVCLKYKKNE